MTVIGSRASRRRAGYAWLAVFPLAAGAIATFIAIQPALAAVVPVSLGTAGSFAVLAGSAVTNTGLSFITGDLGVSPGAAVTPPGIVFGSTGSADGAGAAGAQTDLTAAYTDAGGRSGSTAVGPIIGAGQTLAPGVYKAASSLEVGGALTLDAQGNAAAVFIFQAPSMLTTDSASDVILTDGAQACNVFWQVGDSAALGTSSDFQGSILALNSIAVTTDDIIVGRALAINGAVSLESDTIATPDCTTTLPPPATTTPTPTPTPTPTATPTPTLTPTPTPTRYGPPPATPAPVPTPVGTAFPVTG